MRSGRIDKGFVEKLLRDIDDAIAIISSDASKPFRDLSRAERSEIRYYLIVLAEALMALSYHIVRNVYGLEPATPAQSLRVLADRGLIRDEELDELVKLIRLRNLLVHRYWVIDDKRIYENIRRNFNAVKSFVRRIRDVFKV